MGEVFEADAKEVAGLAVLANDVADKAGEAARFTQDNAAPGGNFGEGLMQTLFSPLEAAADAASSRFDGHTAMCRGIGTELNRAAWMYRDQEQKNYEALNAQIPACLLDEYGSDVAAPGFAEDYPDPARYVAPEDIKLEPPVTDAEDIRTLIADRAGWLGDVDDAIKAVTGWSALEETVKPIGGNWNELKRIGESHKVAGEAMENCGKNLEAGAKQVSDHWAGKAEEAFQDYAHRQVEAMTWEGPVGGVIKRLLEVAADEIKRITLEVVDNLADLLIKEVTIDDVISLLKFAVKKVPFVGTTIQGVVIVDIIMSVKDRVTVLVDSIRGIVDTVSGFLAAVVSPSGQLNELSEATLGPIAKKVDGTKKQAEFARDLASVADADGPLHKPTEPFSVGIGPDPWADAA
ncbi:hypothetical protein [Rhodococcus oryzae]|uniref:hypothetical protein n=1 Tax=Rhodococcus oryzae TaxID=2571143 RepID=UPI0037948FA7